MRAVHKATGKQVVIKLLARKNTDAQNLDDSDETMQDESTVSSIETSEVAELGLECMLEPYRNLNRRGGERENLMSLSEYFMDADFIYFIRPFYNLGSLSNLMASSKLDKLTERELKVGARFFFKAILTVHRAGFLHGDVRPQSIFLNRSTESGKMTLSIGEFERCCPIEMSADQLPHKEKETARLLYLAPEAIQSEELGSTPASEVWSLGVIMYVLATGRYPFTTPEAIFQAELQWPKETPLSAEFKSLIAAMLEKE